MPDSKHLLFDSSGQLWFFDLGTKTGVQIASTGAGSGDDPKFSPDGAYLSYVRGHNIYVNKLKDNNPAARLTDSQTDTTLDGEVDWVYEEELDVRSNYFWSPDSRRIAYLQMNETPVPEYPIEDWIPTHATVDRQRYPQPGDPNPVVRVGVVGANGGKNQVDQPAHRQRKRLHPALWVAQPQNSVDRDPEARSPDNDVVFRRCFRLTS